MANEFKIKKGLIVTGSGGTIFDVQGSQGQLFSVTDNLIGDIFTVSDISGIPILNVNSDGNTSQYGNLLISDNVGIGIIAPISKLHVYQNDTETGGPTGITVEQDGTGDAVIQYLLTGTQRWVTGIDNSDSDKFKIASSIDLNTDARLTIDTTGNVGIGTTTPSSLLELNKIQTFTTGIGRLINIKANSVPTVIAGFGTGINFGLKIGSGAVEDVAYIDVVNTNTFRSSDILFKVSQGSTPLEAMRINYLGNVGIGTSTLTSGIKLEVKDTSFSSPATIRLNHDLGPVAAYIDLKADAFGVCSIDVSSGYSTVFKRGSSESMRIDGIGNVGIGTSSPDSSAILHLQSTTKGFLPPAMRESERDAIGSPPRGLMIYNTDSGRICVYDGSSWRTLAYA